MRFTSTAVKQGRVWWVQNDQHPSATSMVRRLSDAAEHQREAIAFVAGIPQEEVEVFVTPSLSPDLDRLVKSARKAVTDAEVAQREAAAKSRRAVAELKGAGLSGTDVAAVLGVSPQRVSQLKA